MFGISFPLENSSQFIKPQTADYSQLFRPELNSNSSAGISRNNSLAPELDPRLQQLGMSGGSPSTCNGCSGPTKECKCC